MNINGECRTAIANKPENFAKIFNLTYYKTTNNKNIYCANNILKFRLMAGDCVKEFSFVNNKNNVLFIIIHCNSICNFRW